jgi:hypothetical protein
LRVTIAAWNVRAQAAARATGFAQAGEIENANGRHAVMSLRLTEIHSSR